MVALLAVFTTPMAQADPPPIDPTATPSVTPSPSPSTTASATPSQSPSQPRVGEESIFNYPIPGTPDLGISDKLVELIDGTPPGEAINVSYFVAQAGHPVIDALLSAHNRGVIVRVVLDSGDGQRPKKNAAIDEAYARLAEMLGTDLTKQCNRSCITDEPDSINHNKFATFSRTDNSVNVVFQSTSNLRPDGSGDSAYNAAVVTYGNEGNYRQFVDYFEDLFVERRVVKDNYHGYRQPVTSSGVTAYFFPRTDDTDTLAAAVRNVNCAAQPTTVRVMAAFFSRNKFRNALVKLAEAGCTVAVLARQDTITQEFCKSLGPKTLVKISPSAKRDRVTIHAKYITINGNYRGLNDQTVTWMGSHNFTDNALWRNDETFVEFTGADVNGAFVNNWETLWNNPLMTPGCIRAGARSEAEVERRADTETTKLSRRSQTVKRRLPSRLRESQALPPVRTAQGRRITTLAYCKQAGSSGKLRKRATCRVVKKRGVATLRIDARKPLRVRIVQRARGSKRLLPYARSAVYRYEPRKGIARRV
jgi:phosphatidylserine/phosphatidylglycerophosphate/cardiolipin synthase-like enzyme